MIDYFRAGLARSSVGFPRSVAKKLYDCLLAGFIQLGDLPKSNVWARNGLALGYWELGLSDIDLTVWVDGGIQEANNAWSRVKSYRRLLIGGEVQVYTAQSAYDLVAYGNPWELRRDPVLLRRLNYVPSFANPIHQTVFLVRMLRADRGLLKYPEFRQRKWRDHLTAMRLPCPTEITWESLVELLNTRAPFTNYSVQTLSKGLLRERHDVYTADELDRLLGANHHIWDDLVAVEDRRILQNYSVEAHEFLACMMEWEIWGVSSLTPVTQNQPLSNLPGFVRNQKRLVNLLQVSEERRQWLYRGFDYLTTLYRPLVEAES